MNQKIKDFVTGNRKVILDGEINDKLVSRVQTEIMNLCLDSNEKITLLVSSKGGSVEEGFRLYDFIKYLVPSQICIEGLVIDVCASTATFVLQACRYRLALPHSRFMFHNLSRNVVELDTLTNPESKILEEMKILQDSINLIFFERIGIDITSLHKNKRCILAPEALTIGLIDQIFTESVFQ